MSVPREENAMIATGSDRTFDAIIIGSGQGGKPLARELAGAGWRTALIEKKHVGGTCINVGCTPTKTMYASARVAALARRGADYGVRAGEVSVDVAAVRRRKQAVVESFRNGGQRRLEETKNLTLLFGEAAFTSPSRVEVRLRDGGVSGLTAGKIFINTGCRPADPGVEGLSGPRLLDSTSIMELDAAPEHLVAIGGGYIGLEFGQMFRRFGSRVTILQRGPKLLGREDPDVADAVAAILRDDEIEVLLDSSPEKAAPLPEGGFRLTLKTPQGPKEITGSHVLAAAGRVPNTEGLGLSEAGVAVDRGGFVKANNRLETSAPGIWAMGDVKGGPAFTHISYDDFRILRANLLQGGSATTDGRLVPYTVFIDPQLGRIGLTETEARARGLRFRVARLPMEHVARAIESGETRGFMKALVETGTERILGCAVLGMEGGELMAMFQLAMMGGLRYTVLKEAIFAHPTLAEGLNNLFLAMDA
jgi:pyruvate/2-oxoglutarate dehydrogenase complex dihydrolipoamide dehydrogenase (E3) component